MSKGPAIPTKVIAEVARQKAMGKTGRDIAKSIGIPRRTTYQILSKPEIKRFIEDHLDWITPLREEFKEFHFHPFYRSALEVLILFLRKEKERLEVACHG